MEQTQGPKVLVIGCGIGGATAAIALRRANINTCVFERATSLKAIEIGTGIHLWSNAMLALNAIGMEEKIAAVSGPGAVVEHMQFRNEKGEVLADWPVGAIGRQVGAPTIGINRAELHPALTSELPENIFRLGMECTGFVQDDTGVTATFANGEEERGDILVGADGVHSTIRAQLHGQRKTRYSGYTIWQAVVEMDHPGAPIGLFSLSYGRGQRFCFYRVSDTRVYWFAVANAPEGEQDPEGQTKQILLQRFRGWGEPTEALIEGTTTAIRRKDLYDQDPMDWWGKGRVTLLGDAAHAMTFDLGQGAGQSMEDAVILAQCIKAGGDIPTALRTYEDRRRKRAAHFQRFSRNAGRLGQLDNPVTVRMRELVLKHMFSRSFVLNTYAKDITFSA